VPKVLFKFPVPKSMKALEVGADNVIGLGIKQTLKSVLTFLNFF